MRPQGLLLALLCLRAVPLAAQDSLPTVSLEFDGPTITDRLPFDVPFLLKGTAPANVEAIEVHLRCVSDAKRVPDGCETVEKSAPVRAGVCDATKWDSEKVRSTSWARRPADAMDEGSFSLYVEPIKVNRSYEICIESRSKVSDQDREKATAAAREVIDRFMRGVAVGSFTEAKTKELRGLLSKQLRRTLGAGRVIAPETMFDPTQTDAAVHDRFEDSAVRIPGLQDNAERARRNWARDTAGYRAALDPALGAGGGASHLDAFIGQLRDAAADDAGLRALLQSGPLPEAVKLLDAVPAQVGRWAAGAQGIPAAATSPSLSGVWDPAVAGRVRDNYVEQRDALMALADFIEGVADPFMRQHAIVEKLIKDEMMPSDLRDSAVRAAGAGGVLRKAAGVAGTMAAPAAELAARLSERERYVDALAAEFAFDSREARVGRSTSTGTLDSYRRWHASADLGLAWAPELEDVLPYLGLNLYFRPVNRDAALGSRIDLRRVSATLGIAMQSVAVSGKRDDLLSARSVLLGAGLRLNEIVRIGAGSLFFEKVDENPLRDDKSLAVSPYLNLSLDLDPKQIPLLDLIF